MTATVIFIVLFTCFAYGESRKNQCKYPAICITNENRAGCPSKTKNINGISVFPEESNFKGCESVGVYLTGGVHYLTENLTFAKRVNETTFQGVSGRPSIIQCSGGSGIKFTENNKYAVIKIANVIFEDCGRHRKIPVGRCSPMDKTARVALYFSKIHSFELKNVGVWNTTGFGLYSYRCNKQDYN